MGEIIFADKLEKQKLSTQYNRLKVVPVNDKENDKKLSDNLLGSRIEKYVIDEKNS